MPGLGEAAGLVAAACWGLTSVVVRSEARRIDVIVLNAMRTGAAGVYVTLALVVADVLGLHRVAFGPRPVFGLALLAISVVVSLGLGDNIYFEAVQRIGVARALPLSMSQPLLTTALAVAFLGERVTTGLLAGLVVIPIGLYLVTMPGRGRVVAAKVDPRTLRSGVLMALCAAVCWSISSVVLRPALDQVDVLTSTALRICCGSLLIWVFAWRSGRVAQARFSRSRVGTALAAGTLSAGSMFLYLVATQQAGVARAAMLSATSPLYAIPLSALVLGEHVTPRMAMGTLLVIGGVALLVGT